MTSETAKPIGSRVPFEHGTKVWNELDHTVGPWIISEDTGEDKVKLLNKDGEEFSYPALLLQDHKPALPVKFKTPPTWLLASSLLIVVGTLTGYVIAGDLAADHQFTWAWGSGFVIFAGVVVQRLFSHFLTLDNKNRSK